MRNSFKTRMICALITAVLMFMVESIFGKLFNNISDWYVKAIIISVAWLLGSVAFEILKISKPEADSGMTLEIIIIIFALVITAFVFGVVCEIEDWAVKTINACFSFTVAMVLPKKIHKS